MTRWSIAVAAALLVLAAAIFYRALVALALGIVFLAALALLG